MELTTLSIALAVGAALLVGVTKTGMPGLAIPCVVMMAEAFPGNTRLSVGALLPILIVGDVFAITIYRRHAQWHRLWRLFPLVVLGMIPGAFVLYHSGGGSSGADRLRPILGGLVLALLLLELARRRFNLDRFAEHRWVTYLTGIVAGFGTIVGNAAGPVMSVYLVSRKMKKHELIGTAAWFFFIVNVSKVPVYSSIGMITRQTLLFDLALAPLVVVGALFGARVMKLVPQKLFDTLVLLLAGIAALWMLVPR